MEFKITEQQKGIFYILCGIIVTLHTFGIIETGLNYIIAFGAIYFTVYGFFKADGVKYAKKILNLKKESE